MGMASPNVSAVSVSQASLRVSQARCLAGLQRTSASWQVALSTCLALNLPLAATAAPAVTGQIFERVNESKKVSGGLVVGAMLGQLPQRVSLARLQLTSHADLPRRRCIEMTSVDGVYEAWGELKLAGVGLYPLNVLGFSGQPDVVSSYAGQDFAGMLTDRAECLPGSPSPFGVIEPLYFEGDKRVVQLAVNPGQALAVRVNFSDGQATQAAECRRIEGRRVSFGMWCTARLPGRSTAWQMTLTRTFHDGPPRREVPDLQLRLPPP